MRCPISGKSCNKYKAFQITEKVGEKVETYSVCEDCLYNSVTKGLSIPEPPKCPKCGVSLEEILKSSRIGCSECYESFDEAMSHIIDAAQFGEKLQHVGGSPELWRRKMAEETNPEAFMSEMRNKIIQLIEKESYEEVAFLKNKLNEFESMVHEMKEASDDQSLKKAVADFIFDFRESAA